MNTNNIGPEDEPILTIDQAARVLRRHPALLRRWIAAGLIPTVQQEHGHRQHMLSYRALKLIEAMPRIGYDRVPTETVLTMSDGTTKTVTTMRDVPRKAKAK